MLNLAKIADALDIEIHELFSYSKNIKTKLNEKEGEIQEIADILLRHNIRDVKKAKVIILVVHNLLTL